MHTQGSCYILTVSNYKHFRQKLNMHGELQTLSSRYDLQSRVCNPVCVTCTCTVSIRIISSNNLFDKSLLFMRFGLPRVTTCTSDQGSEVNNSTIITKFVRMFLTKTKHACGVADA